MLFLRNKHWTYLLQSSHIYFWDRKLFSLKKKKNVFLYYTSDTFTSYFLFIDKTYVPGSIIPFLKFSNRNMANSTFENKCWACINFPSRTLSPAWRAIHLTDPPKKRKAMYIFLFAKVLLFELLLSKHTIRYYRVENMWLVGDREVSYEYCDFVYNFSCGRRYSFWSFEANNNK